MKYEHLLKGHRLKITPQRIAIIELMYQKGHINIDELYSAIRKKFTSISLATLYKNIHTMMEVSLIREVKVPGHKSKYEIEKESHIHVLCNVCGDLEDIPLNPAEILENAVQLSQYRTEEISVVISGICPECQKKSL